MLVRCAGKAESWDFLSRIRDLDHDGVRNSGGRRQGMFGRR